MPASSGLFFRLAPPLGEVSYYIKKSPQKDFYLQQLFKLRESNQSLQEYHAYLTSCRLMEFFICLSRDYTNQAMTSNKQTGSHTLQLIQQIVDYINLFYNQKITSKVLENKFHCSFDYINRIFKSETGETIFVYLNQFRMEQAKLLIASGIPTMTSIAEQVGYRDIYYFSKVFKKYNGMTPGTYRNHMLSN